MIDTIYYLINSLLYLFAVMSRIVVLYCFTCVLSSAKMKLCCIQGIIGCLWGVKVNLSLCPHALCFFPESGSAWGSVKKPDSDSDELQVMLRATGKFCTWEGLPLLNCTRDIIRPTWKSNQMISFFFGLIRYTCLYCCIKNIQLYLQVGKSVPSPCCL